MFGSLFSGILGQSSTNPCTNYFYEIRNKEKKVDFQLELLNIDSKPMGRQGCEAVEIHCDKSQILLKSKLDHHFLPMSDVTLM